MRKGYKGIIIALVLAFVLSGFVAAQDTNTFSDLESDFGQFSKDVATSLPYAATIGGSWSDAKVMDFPHFGAGLSVGTVTIPSEAFESIESQFSITLPDIVKKSGLGVPLPGYTLDARLGLPLLPFDVGAKFGYMHPKMGEWIQGQTGISADYMLAGIDIRYPILKQKMLIPSITVSAGANYLTGGVSMDASFSNDQEIDISQVTGDSGDSIVFTDPNVRFGWESTSLDFRVQASEQLMLFTLYAGGGYSYGLSGAGGGFASDWTPNTTDNYTKEEIIQMLNESDYNIQISDQAFALLQQANGGSFHAYGGFSVDLLIFRLDLQGKYNFLTQKLGAGVNARVQL